MKTDLQAKQTAEKEVLTSVQTPLENIENLILNIRGKQVMLDRDLARLYGVETKRLNEAVKRNIERFPEDFMFQLTNEEFENNLRSQIVTSSIESSNYECIHNLRSQIATSSNGKHGGIRYMPYVFTESGVSMLSSVLRSQTAISVNIQIMRAFVAMRHSLISNSKLFNRIENLEHHQLLVMQRQDNTDAKIETLFNALAKHELPIEGVFHNGQIFDAYKFATDLIKSANKSLVLIDNYIDESVLLMLSKRKPSVIADIYTYPISQTLRQDLQKHNKQYSPINVHNHTTSHDRFLIIDDTEVYHIGASLKDLGKKLFAFSKLNIPLSAIL
ncbi:MAG: ORF6N domain-containing protein [Paludibacteraceae bacterium]|nr:ORF6N domain-containing protein [Paludibacteraceae bacterium]